MFVSSYSTFIDTSTTKRIQNDKNSFEKKPLESFSKKLLEQGNSDVVLSKNIPLSYISNYKVIHTKQLINQQREERDTEQVKAKTKFTKLSAQSSAQLSYVENATMFSLRAIPKPTLSQTPKLNKKLPPEEQKAQEKVLKNLMINTYVSNENYYRITAA